MLIINKTDLKLSKMLYGSSNNKNNKSRIRDVRSNLNMNKHP